MVQIVWGDYERKDKYSVGRKGEKMGMQWEGNVIIGVDEKVTKGKVEKYRLDMRYRQWKVVKGYYKHWKVGKGIGNRKKRYRQGRVTER